MLVDTHFFFATLGTGVGGALVINGNIYRGAYSMAGYQILENWSINLSYFFKNVANLNSNPKDFQKLQIDLNAKF